MERVIRARQMISAALDAFGVDSYESRLDKNTWGVRKGTARGLVWVRLDETNLDWSNIGASFPVMKVPLPKALPFYRRLLEMNHAYAGRVALSVDDTNTVWVVTSRPLDGLDAGEVIDLIDAAASIADIVDDELLNEFGREYALPES